MIPTANAGNGVFTTNPVVPGIPIGLEYALEAIQQAQRHILTAWRHRIRTARPVDPAAHPGLTTYCMN